MGNHLGIDHPLVAVRNMAQASRDFERLGFFINPRHHHPWGTDNHLLMFPENFIELISIYDQSKLDQKNARGFAFGRFISDSIERREGLSLVALHSEDARSDHRLIERRGVENDGIVDFRRVAHLPDGSEAEAVVSLVMLINRQCPAVSHFLCHQHRPELVWVKAWMQHPNGANGIQQVSYLAQDPGALLPRFSAIFGEEAISRSDQCLQVQTDRGCFEVVSQDYAEQRFAGVPIPAIEAQLPCGIAIRVSTVDLNRTRSLLQQNRIEFVDTDDQVLRIPPQYAGNTIIEFCQSP